ncbi:rubredoxin [Synechococcus sp. PCC 7336]|uniref:rubredoxin n=1 Tax=Synechococcus sp. PCC 7336 TaxID=195250 RepID=UPI00034DFB75|nr:rubredoxin [Synechococcus sp. PCC 7336]
MPADIPPVPSDPTADSVEPPIVDLSGDIEAEESGPTLTPQEMHRYECRSCGYAYEPTKGDPQNNIAVGVPFENLPADWKCPVCGASQALFEDVGPKGKPSGFEENLGYGIGVNTLTPGQKNILIFGALATAFAFFMSLYLLQ